MPTSNVSRHIALLEEQLDVRLFDRTTRRIAPTEAGEQLCYVLSLCWINLVKRLPVTQHSRQVKRRPQHSNARLTGACSGRCFLLHTTSFHFIVLC